MKRELSLSIVPPLMGAESGTKTKEDLTMEFYEAIHNRLLQVLKKFDEIGDEREFLSELTALGNELNQKKATSSFERWVSCKLSERVFKERQQVKYGD